jgi:Flp pilus assembly protein protease CpaA
VLSLGEDALSVTLSFAAILVPLLAIVLVAGVVALVVLAIRRRPRHRPIA